MTKTTFGPTRQRLVNIAKDTITQFLASRFPLKNVASDMIAMRKLNSRERPLLLDLVFRWSRQIFLVEQFFKETVPFADSLSSQAKNALAIDIFALDMKLIEPSPPLLQLAKDLSDWISARGDEQYLYALSPFIRQRLINDYGPQAQAIAKGLLTRPAKYMAIDRRFIMVDDVKAALAVHHIVSFPHPLLPTALGTYDDIPLNLLPPALRNHVWIMDAGSQIVAELIKPAPHERVLDLCAGEGNKARYITMQSCHYVAADSDKARLKKAKDRLGDRNIEWVVTDGRTPPFLPQSFDWILLDAPCTGVGVLRRHPDLMHRLSEPMLKDSQQLQRELLESAVNLLRPEGKLVYATCSLFRAENEQQIESIVKKKSSIIPCSLAALGGDQIKLTEDHVFTFYPHRDDCDGFFVAGLKKVPDAN